MSLDTRYETLLKDMLTLLQQALYRYITQKQVDVGKFKQYFNVFMRNMTTMEVQFHQKRVRFTKCLGRLSELLLPPPVSRVDLQLTPMKTVEPALSVSKPKTHNNHTELNIIQEEEQMYEREKQRRSGTAEGRRRVEGSALQANYINFRPKTGVTRENKRYQSLNAKRSSQTIDYEPNLNNFFTVGSRDLESVQLQKSNKKLRKNLYNELQRQNGSMTDVIYENMVKIPRKKSVSMHRWSFKINKLF